MAVCARCGKELSFVSKRDYGGQTVCADCRDVLTAAPPPSAARQAEPPAQDTASGPRTAPLAGPVLLSTAPSLPGVTIARVLDVVHAVVIVGVDKKKDALTAVQNLPGARAERIETEVRKACASANAELRSEAARLGAQAVIGARFEITVDTPWGSSVNDRVLIVTASGTAVQFG